MINIRATVDSRKFEAELKALKRDQIPYSVAVSLTKVAQLAQDQIKRELPGELHIRRPFTLQGIRVEAARKSDFPHSVAKIGSIDPYMVDFETGGPHAIEGTRSTGLRTDKGSTAFVIPIEIRKALGVGIDQVIPRGKWPGRLSSPGNKRGLKGRRSDPKPFIQTMPSGEVGLFVRTGIYGEINGKRGMVKREKITMLWALKKKPARAPRKQWLSKPTNMVVSERLQGVFEDVLTKAIAGSR